MHSQQRDRRRVLFICGSMNQTTQMHKIASALPDFDAYFSPFYADGLVEEARRFGLLNRTILGPFHVMRCLTYLQKHSLQIDYRGTDGPYDLVVTCSDLIVPRNVLHQPLLLVQEGMTDPETFLFRLVRTFTFLPRWLCSTASTGLSDAYDLFCVASEGYRDLFIGKGVKPEKIVVTGIPNFDDCASFLNNTFPHKHFVLVCTSDARETFNHERRKSTILNAVKIASGRQLIFKLHPNENAERATREIHRWAPGALVYASGNAEEMIANCDVLMTHLSSTVYVGIALGKEVYTSFDLAQLKRMTPIQNKSAAKLIAETCRQLLDDPPARTSVNRPWVNFGNGQRIARKRRTHVSLPRP
jgi:hypothetical protein